MLKELKNLVDPGGKENILYFLCNVIGNTPILPDDVELLCAHALAGYRFNYLALMEYCESFDWITIDGYVALEKSLLKFLGDEGALNEELIRRTVKTLFEQNVFKPDTFSYNVEESRITFLNECLPLQFSTIRNTLISQGFLVAEQQGYTESLFVNNKFEKIVSNYIKITAQKITLDQLKEKLELDSIAGEKAEEFALSYEKQRISNPTLVEKIRLISDIDVAAGFDMVSFETNQSECYDRFIEVKAISRTGFFWSANEYKVAKFRGKQYYLYLIDLSQIKNTEYVPMIVRNPACEIIGSDDWLVENQSYHIRKL